MHPLRQISLCFGSLLWLIAPATLAAPEPHREPQIMHMGIVAAPSHWNPIYVTTVYGAQVALHTFAQLVDHGEGGQFLPDLAESWTISEDGRIYRFVIRPDAQWSDGEPITAEAIVTSFAWQSQLDDASFAQQLRDMSVNAFLDDQNRQIVEFSLREPRAIFLSELADERASPLPVHRPDLMENDAHWEPSQMLDMVFSGPYMISALETDQISLRPNPNYFATDLVKNQGVELHIYSEKDQVAYRAFNEGALDLVVIRVSGQQNFLIDTMGEYLTRVDVPSITYLHLNTGRAPLDNVNVRKAIYLASTGLHDSSFLEENWLAPITAFMPLRTQMDFIPQGLSNEMTLSANQALETARELLRLEGYDRSNPLTVELAINQSDLNRRLANLLTALWSQAFIKVEIVERPVKDHYAVLRQHEFEIGRAGFRSPINHPATILGTLTTTSQFNHADFTHQTYDEILRRLHIETDPLTIQDLTRSAHELLMSEFPVVPLYQTQEVFLRQDGVSWGRTGFSGFVDLKALQYESWN